MTITKDEQKAVDLLNLNENQIASLPEDYLVQMGDVMKYIDRNSDMEVVKLAYDRLSDLYDSAITDSELHHMTEETGIDYETVASLDRETQTNILAGYWWHFLSGEVADFYREYYGILESIENGLL